ncbi:hypothetical protein M409DRAFT_51090 [Zasmidium cellare ATCC 36951]|uniref:NAD(P)-binding domain-containing protein n=1 Tax=Zasmidium cellare ATCC 36951 TaxID=1080233 RepID=A0A6A6CU91_ZASCE|nr:uncharacterized protein M409DRAFT_51090 [Zasmidium cellare ATCC 36951]KAF2170837.1 hypothetical protein M409DRAFT_51090 [Zasmidium cellare ATCC 36951]
MLIVVAGASGNMGLTVVRSALKRGHQVRAVGRAISKLPDGICQKIESFVQIDDFHDIRNLEIACAGADAVICAYGPDPVLLLDGQLALLRAAERAGIKRFHAACWTLNWSNMPLGTVESYDPLIAFSRQAALTSTMKPLYVFCGVFASALFGRPGAGSLQDESAVWIHGNDGKRTLRVIGDGTTVTPFTLEAEVAEFSLAIITSDDAENGGYYEFCSDEFTFQHLAEAYSRIRGTKCSLHQVMTIDDCKQAVVHARASADQAGDIHTRWKGYIGLVYGLCFAEGIYNPGPKHVTKHPDVSRTCIEDFIRDNTWV